MTEDRCDYRYPGNHKRCGYPAENHVRKLRPWQRPGARPSNLTADNHDFVAPKETPREAPAVTTHELKSWPEFFVPVLRGVKNFEVRVNDRNFHVGDVLWLHEWEPGETIGDGRYTGRSLRRKVTYVGRLDLIGVDGFVGLGLGPE